MDEFYSSDLPFVVHYPALNKATGRTSAGYVLSRIVHWSKIKNGQEFYKTDKEFAEELGMGLDEFKASKKLLIAGQLIQVVRRGIPSTSYYSVNMDLLNSLLRSHQSLSGKSANSSLDMSTTNSEETTNRPIETTNTAGQEGNPPTQLPDFLGKTPLARLVSVYSIQFTDLYGFAPKIMNWAMLGRFFKEMLAGYTEWQIAAMILLHFEWHGASGEDNFSHARLADRCFPLEWVPKAANAYRAYIQNTLKVDFADDAAVKAHVVRIIKPLYAAQHVNEANG